MNTSRRTVILAQGIALYAAHMDTCPNTPAYWATGLKWDDWCAGRHQRDIDLVKKVQQDLFDRLLTQFA